MASGIDGEFALIVDEVWCGGDDPAADVLEWIYFSSGRYRSSAMHTNFRKYGRTRCLDYWSYC